RDLKPTKTSNESAKNHCGYKTDLRQCCIADRYCTYRTAGLDIAKTATEIEPPEHKPVKKQTYERNRTQVPEEIPVTNARKRANQHILRIACDGPCASNA